MNEESYGASNSKIGNARSLQLIELKNQNGGILAISALVTMAAPEQKKVIEALRKEGLKDRVKIMVGGGAVTQGFADSIGVDGYDRTAPGAVKLDRRLIGK